MKTEKPWYKRWWIIALLLFTIFVIVRSIINENKPKTQEDFLKEQQEFIKKRDANPKLLSETPASPTVSAWEEGAFKDKFGEVTKEKFIQTEAIGKFSNSATSNSFLKVEFLVKADGVFGIFMHEYSANRPPVHFIGDGVVMARNSSGKDFKATNISKWSNEGGLAVRGGGLVPFLKNSVGDIKIHVEDEYSSSYDFVISADGFSAAYDKMKPQPLNKPKTKAKTEKGLSEHLEEIRKKVESDDLQRKKGAN